MAALQTSPITSNQNVAFGRLHRGLTSTDQVDWKEPKPKPVRRTSQTWKRIGLTGPDTEHVADVKTSVAMTTATPSFSVPNKVLEADTGLQLSMKANSILGGSTWAKNTDFVKLDSRNQTSADMEGVAGELVVGERESKEHSVFLLTETEKYILKQIMNMTHDRIGLQAHRALAESHLVRVQTHMQGSQTTEITEGGYIHLPDRTKMKRHYMKKLGRKASKSEVEVPKECCTVGLGNERKYDPEQRRADLKSIIIPLVPGSLPDPDFRFRHVFVVDMEFMEKHKINNLKKSKVAKVDLSIDRVPVFSAAHPGDKYLFSKEVSSEIKSRSKRLMAGIRIAFNNRLYWRDVLKGKSKPSAILEDCETEEVYKRECEKFVQSPMNCRSMVYYVDVYDPGQEYGCPSQGFVGVLENSPRLLTVQEGPTFKERLMSHMVSDGSLFETVLSLPRLWRHNFYNSVAGKDGILDKAPSVIVLPLDFGLYGGQLKSKQTDRMKYLEGRYLKYFGGVSPVSMNMFNVS